MKIFYRLSSKDAFVPKNKLQHASKQFCLGNFINKFPLKDITILADNCNPEVIDFLKSVGINYIESASKSPSESFITILKMVCELPDDDIVYLVEDDYIHKDKAYDILLEGIDTGADYVTLYDHPDKYIDAEYGGNPKISGGGEVTRLMLTKSCHWKYTNSTCLTFACKAKTIKEDFGVWKWAVYDNPSIGSYQAFCELSLTKGRILISSVPGYSTHSEIAWLSPLTDWNFIQ